MEQSLAIAFTALQLSVVGAAIVAVGSSAGFALLAAGIVLHLIALVRPDGSPSPVRREDS